MCTVSWKFSQAGYDLYFNRDEKLTRPRALPPEERAVNGVKAIAATDALAGGTWLVTNEFGNTVFLLNRYPTTGAPMATSRGMLVLNLADVANRADFEERIFSAAPGKYSAFTCGLLTPTHEASVYSWDGRNLRPLQPRQTFLTSSSVNSEIVEKTRVAFYRLIRPNTARDFSALHRSHLPEKGGSSVCMHRDDAQTVSYSHIRVRSRFSQFCYLEGPPCCGEGMGILSLRLKKDLAFTPSPMG